jgi:hypothetical protein
MRFANFANHGLTHATVKSVGNIISPSAITALKTKRKSEINE